jgi:aryl-alcohol dehydrogenase-like predicted oxidoreductase
VRATDLGRTGLRVSALGFGAMHLNDGRSSEAEAGQLLNQVLDLGITLIDTARGYGLSEERIGRHLAHRRSEFVLSTKVGYGIPGVPDWTAACIHAGVDAALSRMRCEVLDIVHLHSCPLAVLAQGEVIEALLRCQQVGKLRVAAYSGDNAELAWALASGAFGSVQTSVSVCDQVNLAARLPLAQQHGIGVLAKRAIAGSVWRAAQRPETLAEGHYWDRWQAMQLHPPAGAGSWNEAALRFTAFTPGVSCTLVGTRQAAHLAQNIDWVDRGPLPAAQVAMMREAFLREAVSRQDAGWAGLI